MKQSNGFTIIELMMTLAIAAILVSVALPSFVGMNRSADISNMTNSLITSIHMARAEATKRGSIVAVCNAAGNSTSTAPVCGGSNQDWSNGWLVYALGSVRTDRTFSSSEGDTLVSLIKPETGIQIRTNGTASQLIAFNRDGSTVSGSMASFGVCDSRGADYGRQVQVQGSGRPSVITPMDGVSCNPGLS